MTNNLVELKPWQRSLDHGSAKRKNKEKGIRDKVFIKK